MSPKPFTIAIAGNPNCGKTALFNALTGSRQHVGNWPGVTVEKKEGFFDLGDRHIRVVDLPGTYALFANAEDERAAVDFLLTRESKICPVEVKSSQSSEHKSIDEFQKKFSARILHRYLVHTKDLHKEQDMLCIPVYMTPFLSSHFAQMPLTM